MSLAPDHFTDSQALLDRSGDALLHTSTRRGALSLALGSYALAAGPVMAQSAIKTPGDGLLEGEVLIKSTDGVDLPVYRARPAHRQDCPVILVVSEIFGVHEYIADVARRLARAGYMALAPELFVRQGDPMSFGEIARIQSEIIARVPDAQVMADLDACVAWAATQGAQVSRLGITGFCWGGRITWLYAAHQPEVKAGVAWYGRLIGQASATTPRHPIDVADELKAPVLGLYGGADTGIPLTTVEQMRAALGQAAGRGVTAAAASEFVVYAQAPHAFHADYRPTYRADDAADGWRRALAWFQGHGVI